MPYHTHVQRGAHVAHITADDDAGRDGPFTVRVVQRHADGSEHPTKHEAEADTAAKAREKAVELLQKATGDDDDAPAPARRTAH